MKNVSKSLVFIPIFLILLIGSLLWLLPGASYDAILNLRLLIGDKMSSYYLVIGVLFIGVTLWLSFSKYGNIKLGEGKKEYSNFSWGAMIFTGTMAADILFFSLHEWAYYFNANPEGIASAGLVENQLWSATYPLFHWGPTPWIFYILPAIAYAYRMHVKKQDNYRLSQACELSSKRKLLKNIIDIFAILALLFATSTTFSLTTPLMTEALCHIFGIGDATATLTITILLLIATVYTLAVIFGLKGISDLSKVCVVAFTILAVSILLNSNIQYTIETGITGIGNLFNKFLGLSTNTGSLRLASSEGNSFVQDWTIFYWAYWIAWAIATPLFIARISKGRTIRQTAVGSMVAGLLGTFTSFITFGNFGLFKQVSGQYDFVGKLEEAGASKAIIDLLTSETAYPTLILIVLLLTMVLFYATTFDGLTLVISQYTCKSYTETPPKFLKVLWAAVFIFLPIALIYSESTLYALQALSIIFALPVSFILLRIVWVFLKNLKKDSLREEKKEDSVDKLVELFKWFR